MAVQITDLLSRVTDSTTGRPVISALANPGKAIGAPSINLTDVTNWTTASVIHFSIYKTKLVAGVTVKDVTTQTDWKGILPAASTTISNLTLTGGTDQVYVAGDIVELTPTSRWAKDLYDNISYHANPDGSLKSTAVQTALNLGSSSLNGWNPLGYTPSAVTYNGNRSYSLVFSGVDLTSTLSTGMRLQFTRTVASPNQSTLLNGTNQYWSKSLPAGVSFTGDHTYYAQVKLTAYPSGQVGIISRDNSTSAGSGFEFGVTSTGQVTVFWRNGTGTSSFTSYQSIPLNKWVHVAVACTVATPTVAMYINGISVPFSTGSSAATSVVQPSTSLYIGNRTGSASGFLPGALAQVALFSSALSQTTIRSYIPQGLAGTETTLISAYSFSNSSNDLNTTNANNLTASTAVATNADGPFGNSGVSTTLEYALITANTFSTNTTTTVRVPEGCMVPTSGGITSVNYSTQGSPYGFSDNLLKSCRRLVFIPIEASQTTTATAVTQFNPVTNYSFTVPSDCTMLRLGAFNTSVTSSGVLVMQFFNGSISTATNALAQVNQTTTNAYLYAESLIPAVPGETINLNVGWFTTSGNGTWASAAAQTRNTNGIWVECA